MDLTEHIPRECVCGSARRGPDIRPCPNNVWITSTGNLFLFLHEQAHDFLSASQVLFKHHWPVCAGSRRDCLLAEDSHGRIA